MTHLICEESASVVPEQATSREQDEVLVQFGRLPVFAPVVTQLLHLVDDPEVSHDRVARLVESDPGLATDTLTMANSPLFGFASSIESITRAVSLLGTERIRRLATGLVLRSYLKGHLASRVVRRLWAHSLACGTIAGELAPRVWIRRDQAYTAGLLHDIGRIGMAAAYPEKVGAVLDVQRESVEEVLAAERATLGMDHCEAGWWLARTWSLPESLLEISRHHHSPQNGNGGLLPLVAFACRLADALGFPAVTCSEGQDAVSLTASSLYRDLVPDSDFEHLTEKIKQAVELFGS